MRFDFSGVELFLTYQAGKARVQEVFEHPAYQIVRQHARLFGKGMGPKDIEDVLQGRPSSFYGLEGFRERIPRIRAFLEVLHHKETEWITTAQQVLGDLFPKESLDITVYPIIGYDMGIGLSGAACLNCNHEPYLAEPEELLYYLIHECVHVAYERHHSVPALGDVVTPAQWRSYFMLWVQNEGYAVYAPLLLRQKSGHMNDRDYRVLRDSRELEGRRAAFVKTLTALQQDQSLQREKYLEYCFGPKRLTYIMGCELIKRIEKANGKEAMREAFYLEGDEFLKRYRPLLG